jgi:protein DGCR14
METKEETEPQASMILQPQRLRPMVKPPVPIPLEEDEYIEGVSKIIKRDFFPDLEKLKVQNELLLAVNSNNEPRAKELALELSVIQDSGDISRTELQSDLTLDKYLSKYTSEDNASFVQIIELENAKKRKQQPWFFDTNSQKTIKNEQEALLIKNEHISKPVLTWEYKAKSALMYGPEECALTPSDLPPIRGLPKELKHSNTRFDGKDQVSVQIDHSKTKKIWSEIANQTPGIFNRKGSNFTETPLVRGYGFVPATPELRPGVDVDQDELMTWGIIDSTPLLADSGKDGFKVADTPRRDVIGNTLADMAAKSIRRRQGNVGRLGTGRIENIGFKTPLARGLSPAVLALKKTLHGGSGLGQALRATYDTPLFSPRMTPRMTPGKSASSKGSVRGSVKGSVGGTPNISSGRDDSKVSKKKSGTKTDLTDNLLDL